MEVKRRLVPRNECGSVDVARQAPLSEPPNVCPLQCAQNGTKVARMIKRSQPKGKAKCTLSVMSVFTNYVRGVF